MTAYFATFKVLKACHFDEIERTTTHVELRRRLGVTQPVVCDELAKGHFDGDLDCGRAVVGVIHAVSPAWSTGKSICQRTQYPSLLFGF